MASTQAPALPSLRRPSQWVPYHSKAHYVFHVQVLVFISKPLDCGECSGHQGNPESGVSITSLAEKIFPSLLGGFQLCL